MGERDLKSLRPLLVGNGIRRFATFSRNGRALACVSNRSSSLKVRHRQRLLNGAIRQVPRGVPARESSPVGPFIEAARELECDDDKERFEGRLKKIANRSRKRLKSVNFLLGDDALLSPFGDAIIAFGAIQHLLAEAAR
jgi:hypothetical protein